MHAVNQQQDHVEAIERRALAGRELPSNEGRSRLTALCSRAAAFQIRTDRLRLRAYAASRRPTSICSTTRRSRGSVVAIAAIVGNTTSLPAVHARGRWVASHAPAPEKDFAARCPGPVHRPRRLLRARLGSVRGGSGISIRKYRQYLRPIPLPRSSVVLFRQCSKPTSSREMEEQHEDRRKRDEQS
jgi:hypothetical protein